MTKYINSRFEDLIKTLACSRETRDKGLLKRVYEVIDLVACMNLSGVELSSAQTPDGNAYLYANAAGVDIHLRDGVKPDANGVVTGRIEIKLRTWEIENDEGYRNYAFYMNVFPSTEEPTCAVVILNPKADREAKNILGAGGYFAHLAKDYRRNQYFRVAPLADLAAPPTQAEIKAAERERREQLREEARINGHLWLTIDTTDADAGRKPRRVNQTAMQAALERAGLVAASA